MAVGLRQTVEYPAHAFGQLQPTSCGLLASAPFPTVSSHTRATNCGVMRSLQVYTKAWKRNLGNKRCACDACGKGCTGGFPE